MYGLIEDSWISISASTFQSVVIFVLVEVYKENPASQRLAVRKGRAILIAFTDNCGYFSLTVCQNLKSDSLNFSYTNCIKSHYVDFNQSAALHFEWIFYPH